MIFVVSSRLSVDNEPPCEDSPAEQIERRLNAVAASVGTEYLDEARNLQYKVSTLNWCPNSSYLIRPAVLPR